MLWKIANQPIIYVSFFFVCLSACLSISFFFSPLSLSPIQTQLSKMPQIGIKVIEKLKNLP